jgi:hypothetical protein
MIVESLISTWLKIMNNQSFRSPAQSFTFLDPAGYNLPAYISSISSISITINSSYQAYKTLK